MVSGINLQLPIIILKKSIFLDMHHHKPCTQIYLPKNASCINLQLPIVILKKMIICDMCHRKMYMYINFQQIRVCRSAKTVHTNVFAENGSCINLQRPIVILKKSILVDMLHETYMYINLQQNRVSTSVKTVHTNLFAKNCNCINLQLTIGVLKNRAFQTCTTT